MATLDDIARELGVSKSTVSKALSGAKDVSKSMRQNVLEKAVELGYSRGIRNATAPRVAVFITNMEYSKPEDFGYDIVAGFRKAAEPAGFQVDLIPLDMNMQSRTRYDEYMVFGNYCGGLFLGLSLVDPWIKDFETCKTPTVLYDNHVSGNPNVTDVGVDNIEGMAGAIAYLRSLKHTRIGYLSGALQSHIYQQRYQSYFRAMEKNGLMADADMAASAYHIHECVSVHLPRLLRRGCTAILCSSDLLAHSVMIWCRERGIRVPEDLSVMGFDDIPLCRYTMPPLSTIRQNRVELGKSSFYALSSQLNKVQLSSLLLHAELVKRASCTDAPTDLSRVQNVIK